MDDTWRTTCDRVSDTYWVVQLLHGDAIVRGEIARSEQEGLRMARALLQDQGIRAPTPLEEIIVYYSIELLAEHDTYAVAIRANHKTLSTGLFKEAVDAIHWANQRKAYWIRGFTQDPFRYDRKVAEPPI